MAIKDWVSRFASGLGIDSQVAGSFETLVNGADVTRAQQANSLAQAVIALERQVYGVPIFSWNETDLDQFQGVSGSGPVAAPIVGSDVASSSVEVVSYGGVNWIEFSCENSAPGTLSSAGAFLPIDVVSPSPNYVVLTDFVRVSGLGDTVGVCVIARFQDNGTRATAGYSVNFNTKAGAGPSQDVRKLEAGEVTTTIGLTQNDPVALTTGIGMRLGIRVEGEAVIRTFLGEHQVIVDTSSPHVVAGKPCIGVSRRGDVAGASVNRFRNIRCYAVVD